MAGEREGQNQHGAAESEGTVFARETALPARGDCPAIG
jgi:hypothetical protein